MRSPDSVYRARGRGRHWTSASGLSTHMHTHAHTYTHMHIHVHTCPHTFRQAPTCIHIYFYFLWAPVSTEDKNLISVSMYTHVCSHLGTWPSLVILMSTVSLRAVGLRKHQEERLYTRTTAWCLPLEMLPNTTKYAGWRACGETTCRTRHATLGIDLPGLNAKGYFED